MAPYKNKNKQHQNQQSKSNKNNKQKNPNLKYFKQLKKAIKVTKTYEVQKAIRKLKEVNDDESSQKKEILENKIRCLKLLDVNAMAQEFFKSIIGADDSIDVKEDVGNNPVDSESSKKDEEVNKEDGEMKIKLVNSIKRHSRCMKTIKEIKKSLISSTNREFLSKHRRGNKQNPDHHQNISNNTSLLFVESLSGRPNNDDQEKNNNCDNDDFDNESFDHNIPLNTTIKTNRPGQRARKAKKLAMQNKEQGTTWDNSMNWREKKTRKKDDDAPREKKKRSFGNNDVKITAKASDVAEGKDWKTKEDSQHPSWLAASRPEKSATIVPFAGKKITFDD